MSNRDKIIYPSLFLVWVAYFYLGYFQPVSDNPPFVLSYWQTLLLTLSFYIPYLAAWLASAYAGLTLLSVSSNMAESEDKYAFSHLAIGIFSLGASLIISPMIGSVRQYLPADSAAFANLTILTNYFYVLGPLVGFVFVFNGCRHLRPATSGEVLPSRWAAKGESLHRTADRPDMRLSRFWIVVAGIVFFTFAVAYTWLTFSNPTRSTQYFLSDFLIATTIVIPFLTSCVLAFLSIVLLDGYYRGISGIVNKQATRNLIIGFVSVIVGSQILHALLSLGSENLLEFGLVVLLLVVYVFLFLETFGFMFLALGARKMAAIERVLMEFGLKADGT